MRCRISNVSVAIVASLLTWQCVVAKEKDRYSNSWAVEVRGGAEKAEELARKHGFTNLGQVGIFVHVCICNQAIIAAIIDIGMVLIYFFMRHPSV